MDFLRFASAHGLEINHLISGRIIRCRTSDHRNKKNGAYYYEHDFGWCQNWRVHDRPQIWITDKDIDQKQLQIKIRASQDNYNKQRARINQEAIKKANDILSQCSNDLSVYLSSKGFKEMCFSMHYPDGKDPLLCVPMRVDGNISGMQMISPDGSKKFLYGTIASYATFDIGGGKQLFLCEGLASGLSLQKILASLKISYKISICFSSGNMLKIANKHHDAIIVCDNDESGTGQRVAIDSGCGYYLPELVGEDINDECNRSGYFTVSQKIKKILYTRL